MKGSDLAREGAKIAGVELHLSDDLQADLPSASLLVYITRSEGLGSAALLAMAYGVPVVASRVGGLPEIVSHCENGILTDNEPTAIAQAIRRALILARVPAQTPGVVLKSGSRRKIWFTKR